MHLTPFSPHLKHNPLAFLYAFKATILPSSFLIFRVPEFRRSSPSPDILPLVGGNGNGMAIDFPGSVLKTPCSGLRCSLRPVLLITSCSNASEHAVSKSAGHCMMTIDLNSSFRPSTKRPVTIVSVNWFSWAKNWWSSSSKCSIYSTTDHVWCMW